MKKFLLFLLLASSLAVSFLSAQEEKRASRITFTPSLTLSYNLIDCTLGEDKVENRLVFQYGTLGLDVELLDFLTLGVKAGYNLSHFHDPVDLAELPLTLRLDQSKFQGLVFGLLIKSEPLSFRNFAVKINAEGLYVMENSKQWPVELPLVSGTASVKNRFWLLTLDLVLEFQGFSNPSIFVGPRLNLLRGKISGSEAIESLTGEQSLKVAQANLLGPVAGITYELGDNWELTLKASYLSRLAATLEILYFF